MVISQGSNHRCLALYWPLLAGMSILQFFRHRDWNPPKACVKFYFSDKTKQVILPRKKKHDVKVIIWTGSDRSVKPRFSREQTGLMSVVAGLITFLTVDCSLFPASEKHVNLMFVDWITGHTRSALLLCNISKLLTQYFVHRRFYRFSFLVLYKSSGESHTEPALKRLVDCIFSCPK